MEVKVRYKMKNLKVTVPKGSVVRDIKSQLSKLVDLDIPRQKLICKGKVLQDTDPISRRLANMILFEIRSPVDLNERQPCKTEECQFYGTYLTQWYCSQCYRNLQEPDPSSSSSSSASSGEFLTDEPRPVQTNPERCYKCRRKVGLLGFKCRCEYVFCGKHRYPTEHGCCYDWKKREQRDLRDKVQGLDQSKLDQI